MNDKNEKRSKGYANDRRTSSRKGKSGKKNKTFKSKEAKFDEAANRGQTKASNDPSWYGADSPLMHNAANLSFNQMAGMPFDWVDANTIIQRTDNSSTYPKTKAKSSLAGLAIMEYVPMPGILNDWTAPFNVAIRDVYTWIRKSQSGAKNYNAADLGMYVMSYDTALIVYAWMVRIYGMLRMVIQRNRFTPKTVLYAMGIDYDDLIQHATSFRFYINSYAARLNAMKMPNSFDYFKRHMWLTSNVFADAPVQTAQLIAAVPSFVWKYDIDSTGASMVPVRLGHTGTTDNVAGQIRTDNPWGYVEICTFAEDILNTVLNNEDFNIMSGDILKAYEGNVFTLSFIGEDYMVVPVYDPEFNLQFHNANFLVAWDNYIDKWTIYEDTGDNTNVGALKTNVGGNISGGAANTDTYLEKCCMDNYYLTCKKVVDIPIENPTSKDVAIATRFMMAGHIDDTSSYLIDRSMYITLDVYGTEIPTRLSIYHLDVNDGTISDGGILNGVIDSTNLDDYTKLSNAPILPQITYMYPFNGGTTFSDYFAAFDAAVSKIDWIGDFDNFAMMDAQTLRNIHTAALFGMYGLVK